MRIGIHAIASIIGAMLGMGDAASPPSMKLVNSSAGDTGWPDFMPTAGRRGQWIYASRPNQEQPRRRKFRKKLRYAKG